MEAGKPGNKPAEASPAEPEKAKKKGASKTPSGQGDRRRLLRWGIVVLAIVVGVIAWVASGGDDEGEPEATSAGFAAKIVSKAELEDIADAAGHDVYWAGPIEGKELEVSEDEEGNVQVIYVDEGTEPGGNQKRNLTIGSYPLEDAKRALAGFAEREGSTVRIAPDGTKLVSNIEAPSSVYFASPDGSVQVEVYHRSPARAMGTAQQGKVQPIG